MAPSVPLHYFRFMKTEEYGYSLMDVGASAFLMMNAIVDMRPSRSFRYGDNAPTTNDSYFFSIHFKALNKKTLSFNYFSQVYINIALSLTIIVCIEVDHFRVYLADVKQRCKCVYFKV